MSGAKKGVRCVETNSVELAMEWLFSHIEETTQENDEISQALALSLGNYEVPKDNANEKRRYVSYEEKPLENPHVANILNTCMNLWESRYTISFFHDLFDYDFV